MQYRLFDNVLIMCICLVQKGLLYNGGYPDPTEIHRTLIFVHPDLTLMKKVEWE
jgi:hypothetical protein